MAIGRICPCRVGVLVLALGVWLLSTGTSSGQTPSYDGWMHAEHWVQKQWTVVDGLPQNSVNDLLIDDVGFLWVATYDGLARFDGAHFTTYHAATAPGHLPSDRVTALTRAPDGKLWIGTEGGVAVWDGMQFHALTTENGLPNDFVNDIAIGPDGAVWVSTQGPVPGSTIRISGSFPSDTEHSAGPVHMDVVALGPDGASPDAERLLATAGERAWSMGRGAVYHLPDGQRHALVNPAQDALKGVFVRNDGVLVVASESGLLFARNASGGFETYGRFAGLSELQTWAVQANASADGQNVAPPGIWAGSMGAIHFRTSDTYSTSSPQRQVTISLQGAETARVRSILPAPDGQVWVGTNGRGLIRLKPALFSVYGADRGLSQEVALSMSEAADKSMWVGTNCGGVYRIQRGDGVRPVNTPLIPGNACVYSVLGATNGDVWVGHKYLVRYRDGRFTRFDSDNGLITNPSRRSDFVLALYEDPAAPGTFWVGTQEGMQRFDGTRFHDVPGSEALLHPHVRSFLRDTSGRLWIATRGGVNVLDGDRWTALTLADGLPSADIRAFIELPSGDVLIGTYGGGLARWERSPEGAAPDTARDGRISVLRQADGLFENVVSSLLIAENNLWMSGNRGISRLPLRQLDAFFRGDTTHVAAVGYQQESGLTIPETNGGFQPAAWRASGGALWYPTLDGAAQVDPKMAVIEPDPPSVWIDTMPTGHVTGGVLTLSSGVRDIEIPYVGIDLSAPERMQFRYRLDGFNESWVAAGARREAIFTNVPPGTYTFRVEAAGPTGAWSQQAATLTIVVVPRFYEHWFFRLSLLILLLTLATLGVRSWSRARSETAARRERELNRIVARRTHDLETALDTISSQTEQLKQLDVAKSRFFTNTSHEFRTPLSLILAPVEKLLDGAYGPIAERLGHHAERDLQTVRRNAERLRDLTGQLLDLAQLEVGKLTIDRSWTDVVLLTQARVGMFRSAAAEKNIDLTCSADDDTLPFLCDEKAVGIILVNLIQNALTHTPDGGAVSVSVRVLDDAALSITVEDTSTHAPHPASDESMVWYHISSQFASLHGGEVRTETLEDGGTFATVLLPAAASGPAPSQHQAGSGSNAAENDEPDALDASQDGPSAPQILVVDDHDDLRRFIAEALSEYDILEGSNAYDGLALAREHIPDAIISDVMMPGMDGIEFCREIRADRRTSHIPVILLTARVDTESRMEGLQAGADDYIEKPFRTAELRIRMVNLLRRREEVQTWLREFHEEPADDLEPVREADQAFVDEVNQIIAFELENAQFGVDALAASLSLSRRQLTRKLNALLGQPPGVLIRTRRLEYARDLLSKGRCSVGDVARRIGYSSASHFSQVFQDHFGHAPSDTSN